jgi:hypothetical protein
MNKNVTKKIKIILKKDIIVIKKKQSNMYKIGNDKFRSTK